MNINPSIFREYDIRGVWGRDLTPEAVQAIGKAYAVYLGKHAKRDRLKISVGRDVRLSSPEVFENLTAALTASGVDVIDIGTCPTPLQYFSLFTLPVDGGIMITGSHNPSEFNGMKLSVGTETLFGKKIQAIREIVERGETLSGTGCTGLYDIIPAYLEHVTDQISGMHPGLPFEGIKVVIDAGNGTGGLVVPELLRGLGCDVVELYCEPDGNFPNHHPDPVVLENIKDLRAAVRKERAHLGIGYDGDSDRIGVVDEEGDVIWGDRLMIIFARALLKTNPGATIIGEVKCSQTLYADIAAHGGKPLMWKTGHSLIKSKMKETHGLLAGEMSGHIFFADRYFGYDDALYASVRLIEIMANAGSPYSLKELLKDVPVTASTPEIRFDCPDEIKFKVVERVKDFFKDYPVIDIDGVRINFPDGWGLIRASNTQPALVLRFEASDGVLLEEIKNSVEAGLLDVMREF
ncbi:MAG: phosphomannomutase/phosphoglucomutase [Nitrospirae bacterium]|nr:phosphomannomutase/phosphoglucomutase [Nitrospirota bacterium]